LVYPDFLQEIFYRSPDYCFRVSCRLNRFHKVFN